ncbi:MAG: class I SAM-dependent methyltransferase [Proteobacteria bacterium]|nr:class I SAM-dependent methyltransferase [Pseudomonadota bacterium]
MNIKEYALMHKLEQDHWWYKGLHDLVEKIIQKNLIGKKDLRIFDAGCGTGGMLQIAGRYGKVAGIDFSEEAILLCKNDKIEDVSQQDLNSWSPSSDLYDIVICLDVLCHASMKDVQKIIGNFYLALKPNGICLINLPAFPMLFRNHDLAVHTTKRYRKKEVALLLTNTGFQIKNASYRLPHLFLLILVKKLFEWIISGKKSQTDLKKIPSWINSILFQLNRIENEMIISGLTMPFGSSVFLVAQKNDHITP